MQDLNSTTPKNNLGYGDNKVATPTCMEDVIGLLARIMASAVNNTIAPENAKIALNSATRIIEAQQADTRMKALAIAANRAIEKGAAWPVVSMEPKVIEAPADTKESPSEDSKEAS